MLRFAADALPPVHAFWSATLHTLPASLLFANPIDRYLVNSPMLPKLRRDGDGGLTIYVQHDAPDPHKASNRLPAPAGPFWISLRLSWPKPAALDRTYVAPPRRKAEGPPPLRASSRTDPARGTRGPRAAGPRVPCPRPPDGARVR